MLASVSSAPSGIRAARAASFFYPVAWWPAPEIFAMKQIIKLLLVILFSTCLLSNVSRSQPLFESEQTLSIVLEAPLGDLLRQASKKPTVSGMLRFQQDDGTDAALDVDISTRGKSRLEHCPFPPLSVNLKRQQVKSTIFAKQKKLKLVTQCTDKSVYRRYLNQEYAIYKAYNRLSDHSFRVRMLEVSYRDSNGRRKDKVQPAFFIESDKRAAKRLEMRTIDADTVKLSQLEPRSLSILTLFQFMIGNTDWSVRKGPDEKGCCHNGKLIGPPDSDSGWVVLPYDFDQAGLINAKYSAPSDVLPIRSVRQRLYRGYCHYNDHLDTTIALFNENRAAIEALFLGGPDGAARNKSALRYLRDFYDIVNDPKKRQKKIIDDCLGKKSR